MTNPDITFAQILVIAPEDGALPKNLIARLEHAWGELPAAEIGAMTTRPAEMVTNLLAILPDPAYDNAARAEVVEALERLLKRFNLVPVAPAQPLKVVYDKTPDQMSLRELLGALVANPDEHRELRPYIERHHRVQRPAQRTKGLWVIPGAKGGIDVELTLDYVDHLANQFSAPQHQFRGRRPVSLDQALGIDTRALIHPFTGKPVHGQDENGFDLSLLGDTLHEALLWAAVTRHSAWPQQITDLYGFTEQLFQSPLAGRWERILADYTYAQQRGDELTRIISRYWPENTSLQSVLDIAAAFGAQSSQGQQLSGGGGADFRQLVENAGTTSGALKSRGDFSSHNGGVYSQVSLTGDHNTLNGVVIISGGKIKGDFNQGNLLLPPGVRVRVSGDFTTINQTNMSWEELAHHLNLI